MSVSDKQELILVRRQDDEEEHTKGGAWKVAHADFMTAMMAFFLIMWLIGQTDQSTRQSVANYFNPVQLAQSSPNVKGLTEPQNTPTDGKTVEKKKGVEKGSGDGTGGPSHQLQKPRFKEGALFQDPYAVLARIAAEIEPTPQDTLGADATPAESDVPGLTSGEAHRDPFDPLYWQVAPVKELKTDLPAKPGSAPKPEKSPVDAWAPSSRKEADSEARPKDEPVKLTQAQSPSLEKAPSKNEVGNPADQQIAALKSEIAKSVQSARDAAPGAGPTIEVKRTGAGTLISLTDSFDFTMFAVGSAEPHAKLVKAMERIAKILQSRPGKIVIRGHTDGRPFRSDNYDNWRLSQARAQMALYMLVRGGLREDKVVRIEGHADRDPKNPADRNADENRRIEILLQE
jgi:chemotaxis protein MotB